jgi:hypothetical protein
MVTGTYAQNYMLNMKRQETRGKRKEERGKGKGERGKGKGERGECGI